MSDYNLRKALDDFEEDMKFEREVQRKAAEAKKKKKWYNSHKINQI